MTVTLSQLSVFFFSSLEFSVRRTSSSYSISSEFYVMSIPGACLCLFAIQLDSLREDQPTEDNLPISTAEFKGLSPLFSTSY